MTHDELMRAIELLHREQHRAIVQMMSEPDSDQARRSYRMTSGTIRALRMSIAKEKPAPAARAG